MVVVRGPFGTADLAVRVSGNWRIVFRFGGGNVKDVDLVDHHLEDRIVPMKHPPIPDSPFGMTAWSR